MKKEPVKTSARLYDLQNEAVRIDFFQEPDVYVGAALRSFFRQLEVPHIYDERIIPTVKTGGGDSNIFVAVRDRPWPPWGLGGRKICAFCQVHLIGTGSYGLSPVYMADQDTSNIGLRAALYKAVLEHIAEKGGELSYLVIDGSVLADRVLAANGFGRSEDVVITEDARYYFHRAEASKLLQYLGLNKVSYPELLSHQFDPAIFDRNALFQGMLDLTTRPSKWSERVLREIISIDGGLFDAALPGGVPPSPPTAMPGNLPDGIPVYLPGKLRTTTARKTSSRASSKKAPAKRR